MKRDSFFFGFLAAGSCALALAASPQNGSTDLDIVQWKTITGTRQTGNMVGAGTTAIPGAGQPFSVESGQAAVDLGSGFVRFSASGISFAGGNFIGTTGPFTSLRGVLLFDVDGSASGGNAVRIDLPPASLSPEGDIAFGGFVQLPAVAQTESDVAFLLVNGGDMYVAHGSVRVDG